ncbi:MULTISPECIES: hypothetical protein [Streptomycetaceae]
MEPVITVAPDGSPQGLAAAHRAAGEAGRRNLPPNVVYAWAMPAPVVPHD